MRKAVSEMKRTPGYRLKRTREWFDISQRELAAQFGRKDAWLSAIENGKTAMPRNLMNWLDEYEPKMLEEHARLRRGGLDPVPAH